MNKDLKIIKGILNILENYNDEYSDTDVEIINGLNRIFNGIEFENKHPRYPKGTPRGGQFASELYAKIMKLAKDLRTGKYNPLHFRGVTARIDDIEPSEKDYIISEITSNMSQTEKENGFATRRLYSETDKKNYMYDLIYDKDGMHRIRKYEVTDNDVFD